MTYAFSPPIHASLMAETLVINAVRCWRETVDRHQPVLPALFARLETRQAGFLAPAIDALLTIIEAWSGRRFRASHPAATMFTEDELNLLRFLETTSPPMARAARPSLNDPLRIALRSTRIILRHVLNQEVGQLPDHSDAAPIFLTDGIERRSGTPAMPAGDMAVLVPN